MFPQNILKYNKKQSAFTLIELLIVLGIIAIIAVIVIIVVTPGERLAEGRDATREKQIHALESALYLYSLDYGVLPDTVPSYLAEGEKEICNTNIIDPGETETICAAEDLVDLSILVTRGYLAAIPVDPLGGNHPEYGTGYYIAEGSVLLWARKSETRAIFRGVPSAVPTQLRAETDLANERIILTWNGYSSSLDTYNIYRKTEITDPYGEPFATITDAGYENVQHNDTDVAPDTVYYYVVTQMLDGERESNYSNEVSVLYGYTEAAPEGYAWGPTSGWISYLSSEEEDDYGIYINPVTGYLSGYMWSSRIGWINFATEGPFPGEPSQSARLNFNTLKITGWAKAITSEEWILLGPIEVGGTDYGLYLHTDGEYRGWAWGGDTIGWISFSCHNLDECATASY